MSRNQFNKGGGQGGPPNMGWPAFYGYQGYQGQGQYGAAGARGGYNRQGPDRGSEYFVNDEVVGASGSRERQAAPPAAHAGSQHQGLHGMQPWAGVPPSAHAAYAGFPPGFGFAGYGAYGGWEGYSQVAQAYGQMMEKSGMMEKKEDRRDSAEQKENSKERQHFPHTSSSSTSTQERSPEAKTETIMKNEREQRLVEDQPDQLYDRKSSPEVKSEDRDIKTPTDMKYDLLFPPRPTQESSRKQEPPSSPTTSTHSTEMVSPTSRRKQASPQKKLSPPDAPGGATVLITHAGRQLSPDREESPSPARKLELEQLPAKSEVDHNPEQSPDKSPASNRSEDLARSRQPSPERAKQEVEQVIEKEELSNSSSDASTYHPQESAPQRRKSKAEMKEYVVPTDDPSVSPTKVFKKVEQDLEAMFSEKSSDINAPEVSKAKESRDESMMPNMEAKASKTDFQKVEDDLEAMFGGVEEERQKETAADPEKKKRGRKPKAAKVHEQPDEEEQSTPVNSGRATSKRKSAQNAEMKMKDDMDDILDQIINRKKPKKISSSSAQPSIDEAEVAESSPQAPTSSKVESKDVKPEKATRTKSKEESVPSSEFVPKYKKTELNATKDETKPSDTENIFDFQDSEDDSSGASQQKPKEKKAKKVDAFEGILSKQPKERNSKIKLKQGRHGKIATEVSPEKPTELKFTRPAEKRATEDVSKVKAAKGNQNSAPTPEKPKVETFEPQQEKLKSPTERRSRRSRGEAKIESVEDSGAPGSSQVEMLSPGSVETKDSGRASLILDTRRSEGGRRESTDSILVKEEEIEARRSRQRKWEDLDKGKDPDKGKVLDKGREIDKGKDHDKDKPAEKEATLKGKGSKSAESIMLEGSEEIKRIFDESLKNKDSKAEDVKKGDSDETIPKEVAISPRARARPGRRAKANDSVTDSVEEPKPESSQEPVVVRSSRRSRGVDAVAEGSAEEPASEAKEPTSRSSRRSKVTEVTNDQTSEAPQEQAAITEVTSSESGSRPSRRSRGQETPAEVDLAGGRKCAAGGKGGEVKEKIAAAAAVVVDEEEKGKEEGETSDDTVEPGSKSISKKLEIKINKLDLQEAMPKSSEVSNVDLGGLMARYPGLLLAASKENKEKEEEGSPVEPEGRRSRRNRRSSDMSGANKDEGASDGQNFEVSGRGRKRKISSELSPQGLPTRMEVVGAEDATPAPEKVDLATPATGSRRRSRRGSDGVGEDEVVQREVEDSVLADGPASVAEASTVDSANASPTRSAYTGKKRGRKPGSKNKTSSSKQQGTVKPNGEQTQEKNKEKKRKPMSKEEDILSQKGPFIHIEGNWNSPNYVSVVNSINDTMKKQDPVDQGAIRVEEIVPRTDLVKHTSTTSRKYDYKNQDHTWVCVFCGHTSHYRGLGDLFGPYYIPSEDVRAPQKMRNGSQSLEGSTKKPAGKKRRRSNNLEDSVEPSETPGQDSNTTEIWFHEDCFVWIPNVFLIGGRIVGLEEGIAQCQDLFCFHCEERGASVACTAPGCRRVVHVHCGRQLHWRMDIDNFDAKCVEHLTPEERELIPKNLSAKKAPPRRRLSKVTSPGRRPTSPPSRRVTSPPGRRVVSPPARNKASPAVKQPTSPLEGRRASSGRRESFDRSAQALEKNKDQDKELENRTPQKERAAKRSISSNKTEDVDSATPRKVGPSDPEDTPTFTEANEKQQSTNAPPSPPPPPSLENRSTSSDLPPQGPGAKQPDVLEASQIQQETKRESDVPLPQFNSSFPTPDVPTTPKEKPRSHKKKKPPKPTIPESMPPTSSPLVVQTSDGPPGGNSESKPDTSSSLLSPSTPMSSPPPSSLTSPGSETKEKKVRKRTKFDQATIDILTRSYDESPKPETRQKDKRIASGGPVSAGAAYRNPSSEGAPPTMLSSPASSSTTAPTTPLPTSLISPSVSDGRSTPSAATPVKESGNATSRPQVAPDGKPLVKRCHKAKGGCSHIIIDGQHFNRKDPKAQEMLAERERAQRVFTKEELIFGVEPTKPAKVEEEVGPGPPNQPPVGPVGPDAQDGPGGQVGQDAQEESQTEGKGDTSSSQQ